MRGNGKGRTAIVWSQSSANNKASATFTVEAPNFIAFGISFKVILFFFIKIINIMILLFQINAELQSCEVFVIADMRVDILGSITAHNRETEDDSGFVFIKGKFYGIGISTRQNTSATDREPILRTAPLGRNNLLRKKLKASCPLIS
ncbi:hypothetical protein NC652_021144 [Populus alba x Populus x berolinensis]|nr:hypothetical protein NC652_021144 [Populus alba x Populus x berolinensis]